MIIKKGAIDNQLIIESSVDSEEYAIVNVYIDQEGQPKITFLGYDGLYNQTSEEEITLTTLHKLNMEHFEKTMNTQRIKLIEAIKEFING